MAGTLLWLGVSLLGGTLTAPKLAGGNGLASDSAVLVTGSRSMAGWSLEVIRSFLKGLWEKRIRLLGGSSSCSPTQAQSADGCVTKNFAKN